MAEAGRDVCSKYAHEKSNTLSHLKDVPVFSVGSSR